MNDAKEGRFRRSRTEPMYIGRKGTDEEWFFFDGTIDDVRIYGRALTADEVRALSEEG